MSSEYVCLLWKWTDFQQFWPFFKKFRRNLFDSLLTCVKKFDGYMIWWVTCFFSINIWSKYKTKKWKWKTSISVSQYPKEWSKWCYAPEIPIWWIKRRSMFEKEREDHGLLSHKFVFELRCHNEHFVIPKTVSQRSIL